jgi:hypothetical protein
MALEDVDGEGVPNIEAKSKPSVAAFAAWTAEAMAS